MKKLIPNISKMAMGGEPPKKTIYVSNKNESYFMDRLLENVKV